MPRPMQKWMQRLSCSRPSQMSNVIQKPLAASRPIVTKTTRRVAMAKDSASNALNNDHAQ